MTTYPARLVHILTVGCCAAVLGGMAAHAEDVEAISSKAANDYVRKKLPDGTFKPETYAFGQGDDWRGGGADVE